MTFKLLSEAEAAQLLRRSVETVRRLRRAGKLTFIPGRPVRIRESYLVDYLQQARRTTITPKPEQATPSLSIGEARARALKIAMRGRRGRK